MFRRIFKHFRCVYISDITHKSIFQFSYKNNFDVIFKTLVHKKHVRIELLQKIIFEIRADIYIF